MSRIKRVVIIVFDGLGVGELPDADAYGDKGANTLVNLSKAVNGLDIENLSSFGLGLIEGVTNVKRSGSPIASYGRMREASPGKDTATGHWEMCGVTLERPFPTYPDGFPKEMMERFERETGYGWLGGRPASGTGIIDELGEEHLNTGRLIVYTSADSVFQIAAHEGLVPIEELYKVCVTVRALMDEYGVSRVIARPFLGRPGSFKRTTRRKDWPIAPPGEFIIERIKKKGLPVVGVGKVGDIFVHRGLTEEIHTESDSDGMDRTIDAVRRYNEGVVFTNLVDFDTLYGHRNDAIGYATALSMIDRRIPELTALLDDKDMLVITADHGCDPTTPSTDHSREHVPLLVYGKGLKKGVNVGTRETFADLGATLAEVFGTGESACAVKGRSFLREVL